MWPGQLGRVQQRSGLAPQPRLAKAVTLPEHLRAGGYEAFGGGKIFHCLSWINDGYGKQPERSQAMGSLLASG